MATISKAGITALNIIKSEHLLNIIGALDGTLTNEIIVAGPSITIQGGIGMLYGTASYVISASYALSSSFANTASFVISSSFATTASYALSSSFALSSSRAVSSSFSLSASYALTSSYVTGSIFIGNNLATSASFAISSSRAVSASFASTASFVTASNVWGPYGSSSVQTSSYALTASKAESSSYALTASYALNGGSGGSGTPGGSNTSIQFNDSNAFSGSGNFTFNKTTNVVNLTGSATITGDLTMASTAGDIIFTDSATTKRGIQGTVNGDDQWFVGGGYTATDNSFLEIAVGNNASTPSLGDSIFASQYDSTPLAGTTPFRRATILDASGNTSFPGNLTVTGSLRIANSTTLTGSLNISGSTVLTGSMRGQVITPQQLLNTMSINLSTGNFFNILLISSSTPFHISASNIQPGQTVNFRITQPSVGFGSVTFHSAIKQPSGYAYVASPVQGAIDVISLVSFDSSSLYSTAVRNLV